MDRASENIGKDCDRRMTLHALLRLVRFLFAASVLLAVWVLIWVR